MTSGNLSDEPQVTRDGELGRRLGGIVGHALVYDRPIAHRVDDSVVRVVLGAPRVIRRARGFAPRRSRCRTASSARPRCSPWGAISRPRSA